MPIGTLGLILIEVGMALLSRLLAPRQPRRKAAPLEKPTVEEGAPITKGFGMFEAPGFIALVRETENIPDDDAEFVFYLAKMQVNFGYGPIHVIHDIVADERSLILLKPSNLQSLHGHEPLITNPVLPITVSGSGPIPIAIAARNIFGGQTQEGGLHGEVRFYPGVDDQPIDELTIAADGDRASAYPHLAYAMFGQRFGVATSSPDMLDKFLWGANSPAIKPILFILGYYPNALLGDDGRIGRNANPAEMLYALFTDPVWGKGETTARFNTAQWQAKARQLKGEGAGLSGLFSGRTLDDIKDDILSHIEGEVVTNPETGLVELALARPDYVLLDLPEITKNNSRDFRQGEAQFAQTLNEAKVKYRRFDYGTPGRVEDFVAYTVDDLAVNSWMQIMFQAPGRDISDVSATVTRGPTTTTIDPSRYDYRASDGWFHFDRELDVYADWEVGDIIKISFTAASTFSGFVDATATAQSLANRQIVGRLRSESYDYPLYTDVVGAQRKANLLIRTTSRKLAVFRWTEGREGAYRKPLDVVRINEPEYRLANFPVRITKITVGPPSAPDVSIEGVEDLWGEQALAGLPVDSVVVPPVPTDTAPAIASIQCLGGAITIGFQASDASFQIEIERADDTDGTNAVSVITVPGTDVSYTDPQTVGETFAYRVRQVRSDVLPGPWSAYVSCTAVDTDPGDPACTLPIPPTQLVTNDGTLGFVTLTFTDPETRLVEVRFQTQVGTAAPSEWLATVGEYSECVALSAGITSIIRYQIDYYDCDGILQTFEDSVQFTNDVPPPEPTPGQSFEFPITFITGSMPLVIMEIPAVATKITPWRGTEKMVPSSWNAVRVAVSISKTTAPVGAFLAVKFEVAGSPGVFEYLDGVDGPKVPIDEASLDALDPAGAQLDPKAWVIDFDPVLIREEAKAGRTRWQVVIFGGTGVEDVHVSEFSAWITNQTPDPPPDDTPPPPEFDPGTCDAPTPEDATGGTEDNDAPGEAVFTVDGTDVVLNLSGSGSGHAIEQIDLTGREPNQQYTFYLTVNVPALGPGTFLEVVGGDHVEPTATGISTLVARGDTDGSGNISVRYGVGNVAGGSSSGGTWDTEDYASVGDIEADGWSLVENVIGVVSSTVAIDTSIKDSGASSVRFDLSHEAFNSGSTYFERTISGFTPGAAYSMTARVRTRNRPWYVNPIFEAGGANGFSGGLPADLVWGDLLAQGSINGDGNAVVRWGIDGGPGVGFDMSVWFDGVIQLTIEGAGTTEIRFSDFGSCLGSGLSETPGVTTGAGGSGTDPLPDPPPGGYPPPITGGARNFGCQALPPQALGFWNTTQASLTRTSAPNILTIAADAGSHLFCSPAGYGGRSRDASGVFSFDVWRAQIDLIANDPRAMAALEAAIASGVASAHYVIDEPTLVSRWGRVISFGEVERMCQYSKSKWPTWATVIRVKPSNPWMARRMVGLDWLWSQYKLNQGDPLTYRNSELAQAAQLGHGLVMALNIANFANRAITPGELRGYGNILAASADPVAFFMWQYTSAMYGQTGFVDALHEVRDTFASFG